MIFIGILVNQPQPCPWVEMLQYDVVCQDVLAPALMMFYTSEPSVLRYMKTESLYLYTTYNHSSEIVSEENVFVAKLSCA